MPTKNEAYTELYTAIIGEPETMPGYLVGLLVKPELHRLASWKSDSQEEYGNFIDEILRCYNLSPFFIKVIANMTEETLYSIYEKSYVPYLEMLRNGSNKDRQNRQMQLNFFCKRPLAAVLAMVMDGQNLSHQETIEKAQLFRDALRVKLGKSIKSEGGIVHRETPSGAQFSALHAGPLQDISVLLEEEDLILAKRFRPNAKNELLQPYDTSN